MGRRGGESQEAVKRRDRERENRGKKKRKNQEQRKDERELIGTNNG